MPAPSSPPGPGLSTSRKRARFFETELWLPAPAEALFDFLADARNLDLVTPSWFSLQIRSPELPIMQEGAGIDYRMSLFGLGFPWRSRVVEWAPPRIFTYIQEKGPYLYFEHEHQLEPAGEGTRVVDRVWYRTPGGAAGDGLLVRRMLRGIFRFRAGELRRRFPRPAPAGAEGSGGPG